MSRSKPPRKPMKKTKLIANTMDAALRIQSVLTPDEREQITGPIADSFEALRTGQADDRDWANLAEAAGIGVELTKLQICSDAQSVQILEAMYAACTSLAFRCKKTHRLVATGPELAAIKEGVERHEIQMLYASAGDIKRAVQRRMSQRALARAGHLPSVTVTAEEVSA